ncbi:hypothetical protein KIW84_013131 [Lathyrus oleraceus]|uniref:40S ribosomal protein S18 n=1 Tax=Pisum sativum TaxID=3888 RepID=A0A9D5GXP3_PEA|nr:hypothetical protein KIW84_013131 [Pisum sativum]
MLNCVVELLLGGLSFAWMRFWVAKIWSTYGNEYEVEHYGAPLRLAAGYGEEDGEGNVRRKRVNGFADDSISGLTVANGEFQHIPRVLNTNVDGKQKIMFAMTSIKGIGRRFSNICCKKIDIDMNKRAGELSAAELDNLMSGLVRIWCG